MATPSQPAIELWGGIECTINRVGDRFSSQLDRSGHFAREGDLERIAGLGIRTLRFPVLWEQLAPNSLDEIDWTWTDHSLGRLRELGVRPIVGLVHHGSGPRYTDLLDRHFPSKLAIFAAAVARRYPWVEAFTPVNEPLTTARFSGLYGLWYPHALDPLTFARCTLNQLRGVREAMRAIREIIPQAELVQTEDLGKTFSTPKLQYQADFENERRWLTWDLLAGRVDENHAVWSYFRWLGIEPEELTPFREQPCPPDLIGVNHYVTGERYLDENLSAYPAENHGGNGRDRYADVAAVRVRAEGLCGPAQLLRETWERYRTPVAITEAHLGCTREEQLRWFAEVWQAAQLVRNEGIDVRAVTAWSLLGAYDWDNLLTREEGRYEPGAFDVRGGSLRETAVAKLLRACARQEDFEHPLLASPGWWRRSTRLAPRFSHGSAIFAQSAARPLLILGEDPGLSTALRLAVGDRDLPARFLPAARCDDLDNAALDGILGTIQPWAVIDARRTPDPDEAEVDPVSARRSILAPVPFAKACARFDLPFVAFSSAHVFSGDKRTPYTEADRADGGNLFGQLQAEMETRVLAACDRALVLRTGEIFGTGLADDFVANTLWTLAEGSSVIAANDLEFSATYLPDLISVALDLLIDGERGIWHLAHAGATTAEQLAAATAECADLRRADITGVPSWSLNLRACRTPYRVLTSGHGDLLPTLLSALQHYAEVAMEGRARPGFAAGS